MGDHRATIRIQFDFHGNKFDKEWWINWSPNCEGVDQRIADWIRQCAEEGYAKYHSQVSESLAEMAAQREREDYERLKKKYG